MVRETKLETYFISNNVFFKMFMLLQNVIRFVFPLQSSCGTTMNALQNHYLQLELEKFTYFMIGVKK